MTYTCPFCDSAFPEYRPTHGNDGWPDNWYLAMHLVAEHSQDRKPGHCWCGKPCSIVSLLGIHLESVGDIRNHILMARIANL